jgi:hypothetical protein
MAGEIVSMTNWQYWSRWALAGAGFLLMLSGVLYFVVTKPLLEGLTCR